VIWVLGFFAALAVVAYFITGGVLLIVNFWWLIIPVLLVVAFLYYRSHPAVRLKRRIRASVEGQKRAEQELDDAYKQAQAAMGEAARKWNDRT
jgi:membrane protein implicated in regulation of membrane protease activity